MDGIIIFWFFFFGAAGVILGITIERRLKSHKAGLTPPPEVIKTAPISTGEILRIGKTPSGQVWIEMGGNRLENSSALTPEQKQLLLSQVLELRPWLGNTPPVAARPVQPTPIIPPAPVRPAQATIAQPAAPVAMKSIVEQINDVLQAKLTASPYMDRGIELIAGPGGTVLVKDGANSYEGIDAVPDESVKAFIRQAISDWEKTSK